MAQIKKALKTFALALLSLGVYAFFVEPNSIALERVEVSVFDLPNNLEGFTFGVLADLHLGSPMSFRRADRAVKMLLEQSPDAVVLVGDMVAKPDHIEGLQMVLSPIGHVYAVLGNWEKSHSQDYWSDLPPVNLLLNSGETIAQDLYLCGIDDFSLGFPDKKAALEGAPPGAVRILLSHAPDFADLITREDNVSLVISGHSHGGQVRLPGIKPILPPNGKKYPRGLNEAPNCQVYTSRGLGSSHLAVRFRSPPEVTLITLRGK